MFYNGPTRREPNRVHPILGVVVAATVLLAACGSDDSAASETSAVDSAATTEEVDGMSDANMSGLAFPEVLGYYEDEEILFVHTAASDPDIATTLQDMMGSSPVIYVESLSEVPIDSTASVYVFTNGVGPDGMAAMGPFGFQPDVFDSVPGDEGYSPLRRVTTVTWVDPSGAETLTSLVAVDKAGQDGLVTLEQTDIVVNMPLLRWPTGER